MVFQTEPYNLQKKLLWFYKYFIKIIKSNKTFQIKHKIEIAHFLNIKITNSNKIFQIKHKIEISHISYVARTKTLVNIKKIILSLGFIRFSISGSQKWSSAFSEHQQWSFWSLGDLDLHEEYMLVFCPSFGFLCKSIETLPITDIHRFYVL